MAEKHERHEKHERSEGREPRAEEESAQARQDMVFLLRAILEEVHKERQTIAQQNPLHHHLHGAALEAGRLFNRIEAEIALAFRDDFEQRY
jgi:hypothetical protein